MAQAAGWVGNSTETEIPDVGQDLGHDSSGSIRQDDAFCSTKSGPHWDHLEKVFRTVFPSDDKALRAFLESVSLLGGREAQFKTLAAEWKTATAFMSSATEMAMHPAYQQIIGMGKDALPFLLRELERACDHWFLALHAITGADPVPPENRGKIRKMRDAWLQWGQSSGIWW